MEYCCQNDIAGSNLDVILSHDFGGAFGEEEVFIFWVSWDR
jgi:hypothetical protein